MKFVASEWLKQHGDDPIKALDALHQEVEERESDNAEARRAKREAEAQLKELQQSVADKKPEENQELVPKEEKELLDKYRALGSVDELTLLSDTTEAQQAKIFDMVMTQKLKEAGLDEKYLPQALTLLRADDKYFNADENDDNAEVEFELDTFKQDNAAFFMEESTVNVLGGRGKGAGDKGGLDGLADNYIKDRFELPEL